MKASERLHHLDFMRASMMLLGVLVHASHADYDLGNYEWLRFFSGSFRMACFFMISGYFAPVLLERYGGRQFMQKRLLVLGVPAVFCLVAINPPVLRAVEEYFSTAPVPVEPNINWHVHIWFLFVLIIYTLALRPILFLSRTLCRWLARLLGESAGDLLFVLGLTLAAGVGMKAAEKWGPLLPGFDHLEGIVVPAIEHLPYFVFGMILNRSSAAFSWVHRRVGPWALTAIILLGVRYLLERRVITTTAEHLLHLGVAFGTAFACSFALLGLAQKLITGPSRWVKLASESAYTVYIIHYLLIARLLVHTQRWGMSMPLRAVSAACFGLAGGVLVHVWVVNRVPLAAFLLNGRMPARRPPELDAVPLSEAPR